MKHISMLFLLTLIQHLNAQSDLVNYPLPEHHKCIGTNSTKLNDSTSLHLVIIKNRKAKNIELKPFFLINDTPKSYTSIPFSRKSKIISTHLSENILTLLYEKTIVLKTHQEKKIFGIDLYLDKNSVSEPKEILIGGYKTIIKDDEATYFFGEQNMRFVITKVSHMNHIISKVYFIDREGSTMLSKTIREEKNTYIKTDAFVNIGSTSSSQIFKHGNIFYVTYDHDRKPVTYVYKLPFTNKKTYHVHVNTFSSSVMKKSRIHKSFLISGHLLQFSVGRKDAILNIFDHHSKAHIKSFNYSVEKFGPYHKYYFKGKETVLKASRFFSSFNTFRMYNTYLPAPFITVNRTQNNGYLIEVGHVNKNTYRYNPFFHHNFMWQQMMNNTIQNFSKFGPAPDDNNLFFYVEPIDKTSLKLALDGSFNPTEELSKTIYSHIDYGNIVKSIHEITTYKNISYVYHDREVRYMFYNKEEKRCVIRHKKLVD